MKTTTELKEFAQLAQAAYAELQDASTDVVTQKTQLTLSPNSPFSQGQAEDFTNRYLVLNQYRDFNTMITGGFSGTLFQDRNSANRLILAIAGTEFENDKGRDLFLTDLEIGEYGYARPQVLGLYRYIKQLQTGAGATVQYTNAELSALFNVVGFSREYPELKVLSSALRADKGIDAGQGAGNALIPVGAKVSLAGHSLGGHMALLAQRLFPGLFNDAVTVNAPGFYPQAEAYLYNFKPWIESAITRIESVGDGVSEIGTRHPGQTVTVGMETYSTLFAPFGSNHSVANVADGLALTEAMGKLDLRFAADARLAKPFFDTGANTPGMSYENLLDGLRRIITGSSTPPTSQDIPTMEKEEDKPEDPAKFSTSRQDLYINLKTLTDSDAFIALAGKVTLSIANASIETSAKTDFGAFLSLLNLSTIVVSTGNNIGATDALKAVHLAVYTDWVTDKNARLYGDTSRQPTYTDNWYADRAALLQAMVMRNEGDFASGATLLDARAPIGQVTYIHDATHIGNTPLLTAPPAGAGLPERHIFFGSDGNDSFTGYDGIQGDHLYGGGGDDTLDGRGGADYLEGGTGSDTYLLQTGSGGIDTVFDTAGTDILQINGIEVNGVFSLAAGVGGQYYYSADAVYQLRPLDDVQNTWRLSAKDTTSGQYASVADLVGWTEGQFGITTSTSIKEPAYSAVMDFSRGTAYFNINALEAPGGVSFDGGAKSDSVTGSHFNDRIITGDGLSNYVLANGGDDLVVGGAGRDFIRTGSNFIASGTTASDNDVAYGGGDSDVLMGGAGDDQLWGGYDDNTHLTTAADSGERGDWITAELGNDSIVGSRRSDVLFGGAGDDIVHGGAGADLMLGDARYTMFSRAIGLPYAGFTTLSLSWNTTRSAMVIADAGNYAVNPVTVVSGNAFSWTWGASDVDDFTLTNPAGLLAPARIDAGGGADKLLGGDGNDWMAGQTGNDSMLGGNGDDLMYGDDKAGLISETDSGKDLMWGEAGNDRMFGGAKDDVMDGGAGNDTLFGEAGNDFMLGGDGDDDLSGNEGDDLLDGGAGDDRVLGGEGNDTLFGGLGKDKLEGSVGDDTYVFAKGDDAGVVSVVNDTEGANTLSISGSALDTMELTGSDTEWTLRYSQNDTLQLNGNFQVKWAGQSYSMTEFVQVLKDAVAEEKINSAPTGTITLTGTAKENETLSASSTLADADGLGSISYQWFSGVTDAVTGVTTWSAIDGATESDFTLSADQVGKSVRVLATYTDGAGTLESRASTATVPVIALALPPAGTDNTITTNEDTSYTMKLADFGFVAGTTGDTLSAVRIDTLPGNGSLTLAGLSVQAGQVIAAADITDAKLRFAPATNANGVSYATVGFSVQDQKDNFDASPNTLTVNVTEVNDAPTVGTPISDQTVTQGTAFSYVVPRDSFADVDAGDALTYKAILSTGATLPSWLTFNASTGTLRGTAPIEGTVIVRVGATDKAGKTVFDDFAIVVESADQVIMGSDSSSTLIGGIGNDTLSAGAGNDRLDGGAGADKLMGGAGNDTYVVDNRGDLVIEAAMAGIDLVLSSVTYTLPPDVENLTLIGNAAKIGRGNVLANTITGNSANNHLNGGEGADTLIGKEGNDSYVVDNQGDVVIEAVSAGTDQVLSSVTYTLSANVENLVLTGTLAINGTGNGLANALTGNEANNVLNGGAGADSLVGGDGNDTYVVDNAGDVVNEFASEGTDLVQSSISYTLAADVENLTLTGTAALNGTGNELNNVIVGNSANNTLVGGAGNDTLAGGAGNDALYGGTGNDTYQMGRGSAIDIISENDASLNNTDVLAFGSAIDTKQLWFARKGVDLQVSIIGTQDAATIKNWYSGKGYQIEQFKTTDGKILLNTQVDALVSAMAAFSPPSAGQTTLLSTYQTVLNPVITANWK
jgi:Ca2+-binding RTX toxin-like protein